MRLLCVCLNSFNNEETAILQITHAWVWPRLAISDCICGEARYRKDRWSWKVMEGFCFGPHHWLFTLLNFWEFWYVLCGLSTLFWLVCWFYKATLCWKLFVGEVRVPKADHWNSFRHFVIDLLACAILLDRCLGMCCAHHMYHNDMYHNDIVMQYILYHLELSAVLSHCCNNKKPD